LLIDLGGAVEGDVNMAIRREKRNQRQQTTKDKGDPALNIVDPNPTQTERSLLSS